MISPLWAIIPFIISIVIMVLTVAMVIYRLAFPHATWMVGDWGRSVVDFSSGIYIVVWLGQAVATLILAKLAYDLVWRQGEHFRRERGLVDAVTTLTLQTTGRRVDEKLSARDERPRKPVFWAFVILAPTVFNFLVMGFMVLAHYIFDSIIHIMLALVLVSVAALIFFVLQVYMMYFLTEEMRRHHEKWWWFTTRTKRELAMMGYTAGHLRTPGPLPNRSIVLYVVLMLFIPFFEFYWFYALIKDGNSHFSGQKAFENQLIELLKEIPPELSTRAEVTASV